MESKVNKLINKWNTSSNEPALFVSAHWNPSSGAISDGSFVSSPTIMHVRHVNYPTLVFLALFLSACKMSKIIDFKLSKQKKKKQNTKHTKKLKIKRTPSLPAACWKRADGLSLGGETVGELPQPVSSPAFQHLADIRAKLLKMPVYPAGKGLLNPPTLCTRSYTRFHLDPPSLPVRGTDRNLLGSQRSWSLRSERGSVYSGW